MVHGHSHPKIGRYYTNFSLGDMKTYMHPAMLLIPCDGSDIVTSSVVENVGVVFDWTEDGILPKL